MIPARPFGNIMASNMFPNRFTISMALNDISSNSVDLHKDIEEIDFSIK